MAFVELTDPDGNKFWIEPRWVTKVTIPPPDRYAKRTNAVVWMGSTAQAVQEYPEAVIGILEGEADNG
jgi:hypothetical protein